MSTPTVPAVLAAVGIVATLALSPGVASSPSVPSRTQVVLLGTGNPGPSPERSGAATAIIVNGHAYRWTSVLVFCGGPPLHNKRALWRSIRSISHTPSSPICIPTTRSGTRI